MTGARVRLLGLLLAMTAAGCTTASPAGSPTASTAAAGTAATGGTALGTAGTGGAPTTTGTASPGTPEGARPPTAPVRSPGGRPFDMAVVATVPHAWAMTFLPDGRALVTQQPGSLVLLDPATGRTAPVAGAPRVAYAGQGGLGDVILGPTFAADGTVYLSWAEAGPGDTSGASVGRARLVLDGTPRLDGLTVIWRQQPKVTGSGHYGHRLAVSPDGRYLFVSSGERQKFDPAQDLGVTLGKILRLELDGAPAPGNPFADRGGVSSQIWSYGHRNPLGLAFDAAGNLWSSEMGPQGGDEVNVVLPGRNYGWPRVSNGSHYGGADIPDHAPGDGYEPPAVWWNPSISPSSLMIYTGSLFPYWRGDAFVGALSGQALIRVHLDGTTATKGDEWPLGRRIREVEQGPDGSIWLLEDGDDSRVLRLTPVG